MTDKEMETAAGVANTLIQSLRGQPIVIGLLVVNLVFIGAMAYVRLQEDNQKHDEFMSLLSSCRIYPPIPNQR